MSALPNTIAPSEADPSDSEADCSESSDEEEVVHHRHMTTIRRSAYI